MWLAPSPNRGWAHCFGGGGLPYFSTFYASAISNCPISFFIFVSSNKIFTLTNFTHMNLKNRKFFYLFEFHMFILLFLHKVRCLVMYYFLPSKFQELGPRCPSCPRFICSTGGPLVYSIHLWENYKIGAICIWILKFNIWLENWEYQLSLAW